MVNKRAVYRGAALVVSSTLAVTVAFVGLLALVTNEAAGLGNRLPYYAVVLSFAFTVLVLVLERHLEDGSTIIVNAAALAITVAILVALDVEGAVYAYRYPGELVASQLLLYFLAAGCLCTGLVYWGVHHWREFTQPAGAQL